MSALGVAGRSGQLPTVLLIAVDDPAKAASLDRKPGELVELWGNDAGLAIDRGQARRVTSEADHALADQRLAEYRDFKEALGRRDALSRERRQASYDVYDRELARLDCRPWVQSTDRRRGLKSDDVTMMQLAVLQRRNYEVSRESGTEAALADQMRLKACGVVNVLAEEQGVTLPTVPDPADDRPYPIV